MDGVEETSALALSQSPADHLSRLGFVNHIEVHPPKFEIMMPVARVIQQTACEMISSSKSMMVAVQDAQKRLTFKPAAYDNAQVKTLWEFITKVGGETLVTALNLYQFNHELIGAMNDLQGCAVLSSQLLSKGSPFEPAMVAFFKSAKNFQIIQASFSQKCKALLEEVTKNLRAAAEHAQGYQNFQAAINDLDASRKDYMDKLQKMIQLEAEWAPKWLAYDQQMMDVHAKKKLIEWSVRDAETSLNNTAQQTEAASCQTEAAFQKYLQTPEFKQETRSFTTTTTSRGGWFWRRRTTTRTNVHYYDVTVSNPEKAQAESFHRQVQQHKQYLDGLKGNLQSKVQQLNDQLVQINQREAALKRQNQTNCDEWAKIYPPVVQAVEQAKKRVETNQKVIDDALRASGQHLSTALPFFQSMAGMQDDILNQGFQAIGMEACLKSFEGYLRTFLNQEGVTMDFGLQFAQKPQALGFGPHTDILCNLLTSDSFGFSCVADLEGTTYEDFVAELKENCIVLNMAQKAKLKALFKVFDDKKAHTLAMQQTQTELVQSFGDFLKYLIPNAQAVLKNTITLPRKNILAIEGV